MLNAIGAILFAFNFSIQLIEIQDTIRPDAKPGPVAGMRKAVSISGAAGQLSARRGRGHSASAWRSSREPRTRLQPSP